MTHELKIWPEFFKHVAAGTKTYEVRKNDRDFSFGDTVVLKEWVPDQDCTFEDGYMKWSEPRGYTGKELKFKIGYVLPIGSEVVVFALLREPQ